MRLKIWGAGLLILIVGFLLGWSFQPLPADGPTADSGPVASRQSPVGEAVAQRTVSVMLDFGDGRVKSYPDLLVGESATVFDVMKSLSERGDGFAMLYKPPGEYGVFIEQIGDKKGGEENKWWSFWVNNTMAEQAADRTPARPGDVIEWKFLNLKMDGQ